MSPREMRMERTCGEANNIWSLDVKGLGRTLVSALEPPINILYSLLLELPSNPNYWAHPQLPLGTPDLGMSNV